MPIHPEYRRETDHTGWAVGIIVALALLAIGYLVYAGSTGPAASAGQAQAADRAVTVHTDAGTGCQYLSARGRDALTPRLTPDGKQICQINAH